MESESIRLQIARLKPGDVFSRSAKLSRTADIAVELEKLRNRIAPAMSRATNETGNKFSIETGHWMTRRFELIITAAVMRNEDAETT